MLRTLKKKWPTDGTIDVFDNYIYLDIYYTHVDCKNNGMRTAIVAHNFPIRNVKHDIIYARHPHETQIRVFRSVIFIKISMPFYSG